MKKRFLALLVAVLFGLGSFAVPLSASAQGTSGQSVTSEGQKSTTKKKAKKSTKTTKTTPKKKSQGKKKSSGQQA